jgi:ChrR Cupin-like domain
MSTENERLAEHGLDLLAGGGSDLAAHALQDGGVDPGAVLDTLNLLASQATPVTPPPGLKARLMASIAKENRFEWAVGKFAAMLKVGLDKARQLLMDMDDPRSWKPGPVPGCELYYLDAGVPAAVAGFVRFGAGVTFPHHLHKGEENILVLQGSLRDSDGRILKAGDSDRNGAGTEHAITAEPGPPCIYAAVVLEGLDIPGYDL